MYGEVISEYPLTKLMPEEQKVSLGETQDELVRRLDDENKFEGDNTSFIIQPPCYSTSKDKEKMSSDDNEMVEVKVLMALAEEIDVVRKEGDRNGKKDLVFLKSSADDTKVTIPGIERPWLSEAEGFILSNHDTGRILPDESQRNTTDPSVAVTDSSATIYDLTDESSVCNTPLPLLKKLHCVEPIFGPETIKSILRSKSTFKAEALKGVILNEPSLAPTKRNKISSALKVHSALTGNLKSVKIKDDPPLAIVMKELNNLNYKLSRTSHLTLDVINHNRIISLERAINLRNPQHTFKRCEVCGSSTHTITGHYDIEWFKRGEAL
nr:hypothetical protein [Tanacetum cinerariifolium]